MQLVTSALHVPLLFQVPLHEDLPAEITCDYPSQDQITSFGLRTASVRKATLKFENNDTVYMHTQQGELCGRGDPSVMLWPP